MGVLGKDKNQRIIVVLTLLSIFGFMLKLPRVFHHYDKELHTAFYFSAYLFFSFLFPKKWFLVFILLLLFGIGIELFQDFSNKISLRLVGRRIHGRFDPEDVLANFYGLVYGAITFLILKRFRR
jgi:hypothetical protein